MKHTAPKPKYRLTRSERETIIVKADDEDAWHITSHSPAFQRLMKRRGHKGVAWGYDGMRYDVPVRCVSIRGARQRVKKEVA